MALENVRSLARGLAVVDLLMTGDPAGLRPVDIARGAGVPANTALRLLATLEQFGWVRRTPDGRYQRGPKLAVTDAHGIDSVMLAGLAREPMQQLRDITAETVILTVRVGQRRLVLEVAEGNQLVRAALKPGEVFPLLAGATGFALMADASDAEIAEARRSMESYPGQYRTYAAQPVDDLLTHVRTHGWLIQVSQIASALTTVGAPVRADGRVVAGLGVCGPAERWNPQTAALFVGAILDTARVIGERVHSGDPEVDEPPRPRPPS